MILIPVIGAAIGNTIGSMMYKITSFFEFERWLWQQNVKKNSSEYCKYWKQPIKRHLKYILELDEIEKELALYKFKYEMALAEKSIEEEGTISADELEVELGVK